MLLEESDSLAGSNKAMLDDIWYECTKIDDLTSDNTDSVIIQELGGQHVGLGHVLLLGPELEPRRDRPVSTLVAVDDSIALKIVSNSRS
jgi:hypothetical protein